jgi:hypothetical protein
LYESAVTDQKRLKRLDDIERDLASDKYSQGDRIEILNSALIQSKLLCNCFLLGKPPTSKYVLYSSPSFFNHSDDPNMSYDYDAKGRMTCTANRVIPTGSELTIRYAQGWNPKKQQ